jgi:polyhydroxybutyrate depolymerase
MKVSAMMTTTTMRSQRCWLLVAVAALGSACGGGSSTSDTSAPPVATYSGTPGDFSKTVSVAGVTRNYLLHVPASYRSMAAMPVVLLLHGGQGSATTVPRITSADGFSGAADRHAFIAVYPDSLAGNWDDGRDTIPTRTNDVAFVAALLDAVAIEYNVDAKRVYASGISNGGMMSIRLACELSSRIAAIASVAAQMPQALVSGCKPSRPVPVVMFSGTADPLMPYGGGTVNSGGVGFGGTVLSAAATVNFWLTNNTNLAQAQSSALPDADGQDGTTTDVLAYGTAEAPGEVLLYRVNEGGHTWPGGTQYRPTSLIGRVSGDFSANDAMWAFFSRHRLP